MGFGKLVDGGLVDTCSLVQPTIPRTWLLMGSYYYYYYYFSRLTIFFSRY